MEKGREKCTLSNLRVVLQRTNVNGQVKVRFKAHEDFILTASKAYPTELVQEHFGMPDKESPPNVNMPPPNVEKFEAPRRQRAFDEMIDAFLDKYVCIFQLQVFANLAVSCVLLIKIAIITILTSQTLL